ncbi:MAG TPA: hypothetical protein PLJ47_14045 [Candidatus Hydrogenedentes bacterium]|nr:hypothetical protein [Candidatus Hydrogenedentota bacterium]
MMEEIDDAIQKLKDTKAGWVTRRDASEFLGKVAGRALNALQESSDEMDVDVRRTVDEALGKAAAILQGVKPILEPRAYGLDELVKACAKPGVRDVEQNDDSYVVRVTLKNGRGQTVHVREFQLDQLRPEAPVMHPLAA